MLIFGSWPAQPLSVWPWVFMSLYLFATIIYVSGLFWPLFPFLSWANSDSLLHISQYGNHANSFVQVLCLLISNFHNKIIINIPTCTNELALFPKFAPTYSEWNKEKQRKTNQNNPLITSLPPPLSLTTRYHNHRRVAAMLDLSVLSWWAVRSDGLLL